MTFLDKYGDVEIRALSWKQPFCSLMLHGKIETRVWGTGYLGWVLMCASKAPYKKETVYNICSSYEQYMNIVDTLQHDNTTRLNGMALCIGKLVDCRSMHPHDEAKAFVKYCPDLMAHIYAEVQPIKPFDWKGSQGWKTLNLFEKQQIILL